MPFFDQHWRLRAWGAALAALAAVLLPVRYLQVAAIWDAHRGWDLTPDVIFAVLSALILALAAELLARSVGPARRRQEFRRAIIEGRETPPREQPEPAAHGEPPLVVVLRIDIPDRMLGGMSVLLLPGVVLASIVVVPWMVELLLGASAAQLGFTGGRAFLIVIVALFMPFAFWLFGTWVSNIAARSPRYTADASGLAWRSRWGRTRTVRWDDARLLELTTHRRPEAFSVPVPRFLLYGHGIIIRIDVEPGFYRDTSRLIDLIQRRTGLALINLGKPWPPEPAGAKIARLFARMPRQHDDDDDR